MLFLSNHVGSDDSTGPSATIDSHVYLLMQAAVMKKKVPWLRYEEKKVCLEQAKHAETLATKKLQDIQILLKQKDWAFQYVVSPSTISRSGASVGCRNFVVWVAHHELKRLQQE